MCWVSNTEPISWLYYNTTHNKYVLVVITVTANKNMGVEFSRMRNVVIVRYEMVCVCTWFCSLLETRECRTRTQRSRTNLVWSQKEFPLMVGMTVFKTSLSPIFCTVVFHCSLLYPVISNPKRLILVKVITTDFPISGLAKLVEGNIRSYLER